MPLDTVLNRTRFARFFAATLLFIAIAKGAFAGAGAVDTTFTVLPNGTVYSVLTLPNGKILVGGAFTTLSGIPHSGVARLYPDGTLDTNFVNSFTAGGTVYAMLLQPDGKLLVAGNFEVNYPQTHQNVVRLNVDGTVDGTFTNSPPSGIVYALGLQQDGKILIGGQFSYLANSNHYYIARLNPDGTVDNTFNPGVISGSAVNAIAVQSDGNILIGGSFSSFSTYGLSRQNIARLLTNGTPDLSYQPSASGPIQGVYLQDDGKSVWCGSFTGLGNFGRSHVGRLNTDGSVDATFNTQSGPNNTVYAVTEDTNDNVYLGGIFLEDNNLTREGVSRHFSDGTLDSTFNNTTNFITPTVRCLAIQPDGKVLVGGSFFTYNSVQRTNLIRLYGDTYPAEIVTQPRSTNVTVGTNVTFSVDVSNPTPVDYQWRYNGVDIPGATDNEYSLFNVQLADAGTYSVFVSSSVGGITSSNAVLQVGIPPAITQQPSPSSLIVTQGQTAVFTVGASGTPLNYYWLQNGRVLAGTNATLTLTNVTPSQAGSYSVVVSNFLGGVDTGSVTLIVYYPVSITSNPQSVAIPVGGSATLSVGITGNPLYFQWLENGNPIPGATNSFYSLNNVTLANAGGYSVIVSNQFNSMTSAVANVTVGYPPILTTQPASLSANLGDTVTFNSLATGSSPLTYQWSFNGNLLANQTNTSLTLTNVQIANIGNYSVSVANAFGSAASSNAFLNLNGYPSNLYFGLVAYYPFNGNANDATGNGNNGTVNGAVPSADRFGDTTSAYEFFGGQDILFTNVPITDSTSWTMSVWMSADVLPQAGIAVDLGTDATNQIIDGMEIGISDGNFGTGNSLFGALSGNTFASGYSFTNTNEWHQAVMVRNAGITQIYVDGEPTTNTSIVFPNSPSSFTIGSATGQRYFQGKLDDVRIYNHALSSNDIQQLYQLEDGVPFITQQPQSQMVVAGANASFNVQAVGGGALSYQWYYSNAPLANATNPVLTVASAQPTNSGAYYVVVSNNLGSVTSAVANLVVGLPPQNVQLSLDPASGFPMIQMPGTAGFNYVLQVATNLQPPIVWQIVTNLQADTNGNCNYLDTNAPAFGARFYRVSTQ